MLGKIETFLRVDRTTLVIVAIMKITSVPDKKKKNVIVIVRLVTSRIMRRIYE